MSYKGGLCSTELEQSRIENTHATQSKISMDPVYYSKGVLVGDRKWNDTSACESFKGDSLSRYDQDERDTDGVFSLEF